MSNQQLKQPHKEKGIATLFDVVTYKLLVKRREHYTGKDVLKDAPVYELCGVESFSKVYRHHKLTK